VLASTFMDMVLGVDIHFEMVPMPAPVPTPIPNPFVGMVYDPGGLLSGQAMGLAQALLTMTPPKGPVMINMMPATTVGTNGKNSMGVPHILMPPGTAWAPMPKMPKPSFKGPPPPPGPPVAPEGDAIVVFGSPTVTFMGTSASRMGDKAMSCGEPVRLPSSTIVAIPKGMPVMVGGPPALSISDAAGALLKSKWIAGPLHDLISRIKSDRLRNILSKAVCFLTGHPVDVATGRVLTDHVDWDLPGPLPLRFERNYSSAWANRAGPLGHGWSHTLDQAVWAERGRVVYLDAEGRELEFDTFGFHDHVLATGQSVYEPMSRLTLKALGQRRYEITTHDGVTHEFAAVDGAAGPRKWWSRLVRKTARDGAAIELEYDREGNLAWVRDAAGRQIAFEHDRAGRLVAMKLPHPTEAGWQVHTRFAYDAAGDLVQATDPLGHSWRFAYKQHLLVQETNRNGLSFYFAYDGHGQDAYCVRTWGDGGIYDHVLAYDKLGKVTCVTNSLGHTTTYKMNVAGCVTEVIDALGGARKFEYDERTLRKVKETDPVGGERKWEHDARGNVIKTTGPDGAKIAIEYNERNQPVRAIDAVKGEWQWGYDERGRLIGRVDSMNRRAQFHWRANGESLASPRDSGGRRASPRDERPALKRLVGVTDPAGQTTSFAYDAEGNVSTLRTPDGAERRWEYDGLGRCTAVIDAKRNAQRREHDSLGRIVRVWEPDGNLREISYDREGSVVLARDKQYDVGFAYRGMGKLASRTQAGTTVRFAYDTEERLVGITNEHGFSYRFELGPTGTVDSEYGFDDWRRRYQRDKAGRVTKVFRPEGRETEYEYDPAGRVVGVKYSTGEAEAYAYRGDGELVQAKNSAADVKFERDLLGRITREVVGDDWVASDYDALGMRVRVRSSAGLDQRITRDAMGRPVGVRASVSVSEIGGYASGATHNPWEATIARDIMGLELERTLPGGVKARWERDAVGRPVKQEVWAAGEFRRAVQYTWDVNHRLKTVIDAIRGPTRYEHDAFGNLAAATYEDGRADLRMPDAVGNLFRTADRSDRTYGRAGQLLQARRQDGGVTRYEYDGEGNLVRRFDEQGAQNERDVAFRWNSDGTLAEIIQPGDSHVEFRYDAFNRRIAKNSGDQHTRWIWDGQVPLHEIQQSVGVPRPSAVLTTYLFEPERFSPIAEIAGGGSSSVLCDYLGVPAIKFDDRNGAAWTAQVDINGGVENNEHGSSPFRWPGQYSDRETGLSYNRFRYYDPSSGQYLSSDPARIAAGIRAFAYPGDPLRRGDPLGLVDTVLTQGIVYRGGPNNTNNLTPRPWADVDGPKAGLSTFQDIEKAADPGKKVQVIDIEKLGEDLEAVLNDENGHVSIRPTNDPTGDKLRAWADQRGTDNPLTAQVQEGITEETRVPKCK
jgi:RHS repeat-associated protein